MLINKPRLVIAAPASGSGKTTVVTGLLAALKEKGKKVQAFKIGPDYIDPGFHQLASGRAAHNLDSWLVPERLLPEVFAAEAGEADLAIIEGVMGLYDGGKNGVSSTAAIAKALKAPVVLVVNCKAAGESIAALVLGFLEYDKEVRLQGVILNNLGSASHAQLVQAAVEKLGVKVLGSIIRKEEISLPERHLGLTPVEEQQLTQKIAQIKKHVAQSVDLEALCSLAETAEALDIEGQAKEEAKYHLKIGVAFDKAFSFYYRASLEVLQKLGAELVFFSPLKDQEIPQVDGLIFGGGFPELFARELSQNKSMLRSIQKAAEKKLPIYAECGGFMYLAESLTDFAGYTYSLAGLIPGKARMQNKLQTVGYVRAKCLQDSLLGAAGEFLQGHEFHFSTFSPQEPATFPWAFAFEKVRTGQVYQSGYAKENILASYLHLNFLGCPEAARRFLESCRAFQTSQGR